MSRDVNWVLEADIRGFFDNVSHDWLMKFLAHDIQDKNFLRYIKRFLKAGIMEDGQFIESTQGTPQGGLISPILANVYLHYVLDDWMVHAIIPKLRGKACYVRYADDFVILFQNEDEARETLEKLKQRLAIFSLEVAEEKTRILPFGPKYGTQEDFDFLGFTIYNTTTLGKKTKKKWYRVGIRTCMTKLKAKMQLAKKWIKAHMHMKVKDTLKQLNLKYRGHCQYYGVNGNIEMLAKFRKYLMYILFKTMRRRGQKGKISWDRFIELWEEFIDKPKIKVQIWKGR